MFAPRTDKKQIETGPDFAPKFDADGLIVAIAQDAGSGQVLMVAYMNAEALQRTLEIGQAVYWSRSRREIWHKGATSGHVQHVEEILTDCDQDALVLKVRQIGEGACHVGYRSCFYRRVHKPQAEGPAQLETLGGQTFDAAAVYRPKA